MRYCTGLSLYPLAMVDLKLPSSLITITTQVIPRGSSTTQVSSIPSPQIWSLLTAFIAVTLYVYDDTKSSLGKGLFDEDNIKSFSILNVWSITAVIAFIEVVFLNSIRRQSVS